MRSFTLCLLVLLGGTACLKKDTCNTALGDTFEQVDVSSVSLTATGQAVVALSWEALDTLPSTYFQAAQLQRRQRDYSNNTIVNDWETVEQHQFDPNGGTVTLKAANLPAVGSTQSYALYFSFLDRMDYIDCFHPGSGDIYDLNLSFELERPSANDLRLVSFEWAEIYDAGGF